MRVYVQEDEPSTKNPGDYWMQPTGWPDVDTQLVRLIQEYEVRQVREA
jgi:hypothetical protein